MSRNAGSRFAVNPTTIDMSRSRFSINYSHKTSFNVGDLIPFYCQEVLPGDTFDVETSRVVRMQSLITPIMDNIYLDMYYFFVPDRIVWSHWKNFMGENTESAWVPTTEYEVPQITAPDGTGWTVGSVADHFGIPTGVAGLSVNALPFRAYALICNEWFRDENLTDPLNIPVDDSTVAGVNSGNYVTDVAKGGAPFKAAKYHDYFTSCLPAPQKGPDVTIPLLGNANLPVVPLSTPVYSSTGNIWAEQPSSPMSFYNWGVPSSSNVLEGWAMKDSVQGNFLGVKYPDSGGTLNRSSPPVSPDVPVDSSKSGISYPIAPNNLWAINSGNIESVTINQLRLAFQIQKLYEKDARGGTRYIEVLKAHFGVTSPDARLQRPEYLGGNRIPININQVLQQSATQSDGTPQGNPVGQSLTTDTHHDFKKSFVEHGFVIGLMVARYDHTYQQGLERFWSRKTRFDYYWPVFANIGEQAVLNKEIYAQGSDEDNEVFGYQEAWADYRYKPSQVTGEMRSQYDQSLDVWHLADDYSSLPALSDSWIREDSGNVNRVLAVSEQNANQLFCDIFVRNVATRPLPMYSIPGLIDHH